MNLKRNWKASSQTVSSCSYKFSLEVLGRWPAVAAKQLKMATVIRMALLAMMMKILQANRPSPLYLTTLQLASTPRIANYSVLASILNCAYKQSDV